MTNKELIEKLKKLPQDAEVWLEHDYAGRRFVSGVYSEKEENIIVIE
jgi:hypothetical protein